MAREMKTSRFYWVGNIPSHWKQIKLGYLCSLKGRIGWKGLRSDEFLENSYAYLVTGQDFKGDTVNWEACYQIEKGRYDEDPYIQLREGDLLVTKDGTIGKIAKIRELEKPACLNSGIFVLRQTAKLFNQSYLYWQLNSSLLTDYNMYVNSGASTIQHLYQNVFERMPLLVPPLSEQQAIADFLDKKCYVIDGLLDDLDAEVKTLAEYKKSIIAEMVTHGMNPNVPVKQSGIPWAEKTPAHWKIEKGKYLFKLRRTKGNPHNLELMSPTQKFGVIPQSQLEGVVLVKEKTDLNTFRTICPGDFCISLRSFQGGFEYSKYEGVVSPAYQVFYPIKPIIDGFFKYMFKSDGFISYINTFSMSLRDGKNIAFEDFGNSYIPIPPIEEQVAISNYLDEKCTIIEQSIADKQNQIETLKSYKASLIYEYVTGKKQVI